VRERERKKKAKTDDTRGNQSNGKQLQPPLEKEKVEEGNEEEKRRENKLSIEEKRNT